MVVIISVVLFDDENSDVVFIFQLFPCDAIIIVCTFDFHFILVYHVHTHTPIATTSCGSTRELRRNCTYYTCIFRFGLVCVYLLYISLFRLSNFQTFSVRSILQCFAVTIISTYFFLLSVPEFVSLLNKKKSNKITTTTISMLREKNLIISLYSLFVLLFNLALFSLRHTFVCAALLFETMIYHVCLT